MKKISFLNIGALCGALAVVLGAFGAHGLENKLSPEQLATYRTGVDYHFYHAIVLLVIGFFEQQEQFQRLRRCGWLLLIGILLFSGSLYLLACREWLGLGNGWRFLGPLTPLGGLCFIVGWLSLLGVKKMPKLPAQ